jgi:hypothetical protein
MTENVLQDSSKDRISSCDYWFVALWAAGLILFYVIAGYFAVRQFESYKAQTARLREEWIKAPVAGQQPAPDLLPAEAKPVDVNVGIFMHRSGEFSMKDNQWTADFDIWFIWTGEDVHPGENFEVVNGQVELRDKKDCYSKAGQHYERYHVRARIIKDFDTSRFPLSDIALDVQIEDGKDDAQKLRYVPDKQGIILSSQIFGKVLKITQSGTWVKLNNYTATQKVHSRFISAILIEPPGLRFYDKMFQALFASIAIAFIVLFIKPTHVDPRFGLVVGALFAVVGNNIYIQSYLPVSANISLVDMAGATGLVTIFLILVQSAVSLYIFDTKGQERLSRFFDKVSFAVLLLGYVILNILLPFAAKS